MSVLIVSLRSEYQEAREILSVVNFFQATDLSTKRLD